jgi:chromosome partitioning protein
VDSKLPLTDNGIVNTIFRKVVPTEGKPMIISVLNQKGGVGKTTLSTSIAAALAAQGEKVLLVDADPQHSALDWGAKRESTPPFTLMGLPTNMLHRDLPPLIGNPYTVILIDGPGKLTDIPRSAIMASDVVLIPVQPSPYDVWSSADIIKILREAQSFGARAKAAFVVNRKIPNTVLGREVTDALAEQELPVFETQIQQRQCYATTAGDGLTVSEMKATEASHKQAAEEIRNLVEELVRFANV